MGKNKKEMVEIAVVHDRLENKGGGERVALELAKALNAKTIYVACYTPEKTYEEFEKFNIVQLNRIPSLEWDKAYAIIRMIDAFRFLIHKELEEYDLLWLSGMWAVFASNMNSKNIWYCHSPNRALYDLYESIKSRYNFFWRTAFDLWAKSWRLIDRFVVMRNVKEIVVNSRNTQRRVVFAYGLPSHVIYPPVDTKKCYHAESDGYWLSVQRIMPEKRVDLQIEIFKRLPNEKLIIVGKAEYGTDYQKKIAKMVEKVRNVEWVGRVDEKTLIDLYAHCKGVIQTPIDEDFGMVPIEAMASGKPVLCVNEGGFRESVIHSKTGLLINPPYLANFIKAIKNFDETKFNPKIIRKRAEFFDISRFRKQIREKTKEVLRDGSESPDI